MDMMRWDEVWDIGIFAFHWCFSNDGMLYSRIGYSFGRTYGDCETGCEMGRSEFGDACLLDSFFTGKMSARIQIAERYLPMYSKK